MQKHFVLKLIKYRKEVLMARPERNNVDYFPFYCEDGNKMFYIEETYGNDGFATFIKLLRELAKTNYHYLDLSKATTVMFLSAKCKVTKETLLSIINDLVDLGKFDSVLWNENKVVWCNDFVESIQDAYERRKNECITYEGLILHLISLGIRKPNKCNKKDNNNTQTILKDSKEDKTKEKEINWDELLSFFNKATNKKCRVVPKAVKSSFNARLSEGFTKEDIATAIKNCSKDSWHIDTEYKFLTLEFISRADKLDKFCNIAKHENQTTQIAKHDN